jgi:hypothetical protein
MTTPTPGSDLATGPRSRRDRQHAEIMGSIAGGTISRASVLLREHCQEFGCDPTACSALTQRAGSNGHSTHCANFETPGINFVDEERVSHRTGIAYDRSTMGMNATDAAAESPVVTIAFVDLAGFTALTDAHGDVEAITIAKAFQQQVIGALGPGDRLVKTIGDAVMLAFPDPAAGTLWRS